MDFFVSLLFLFFCFTFTTESHGLHFRKLEESTILTTEEHWLDQTLDHFSSTNHRTFKQRYYEYLGYYQPPKRPIFLIIGGEWAWEGIVKDYVSELAEKFGAALVAIEHRYYGKSSPFKELSTDNLKFLSTKQVLFDLAVFRQYYQEQLNSKYNVPNAENPWFVFGISYAGGLSAWFRLKFPHLTCGSLASSALISAIYNFTEFDQQVANSAGAECKAALQQVANIVDKQLISNTESIKNLFGAAKINNDADFRYLVADAAALTIQYAAPNLLCYRLVDAKKNGANLLEVYADYVRTKANMGIFGTPLQYYDRLYLKNTTSENSAHRLWWFYSCSEMGYFQVAPKNKTVRSAKIDTRYFLDFCKDVFGEGVYPDVDMTNLYYGGTKISGSRIIFTNGSQDPWRHASKQTSSKDLPSYLMKCKYCGHGVDVGGCPISTMNIEGQVCHRAVEEVRLKIMQHIDKWLSDC